jgi:hypothetical protein
MTLYHKAMPNAQAPPLLLLIQVANNAIPPPKKAMSLGTTTHTAAQGGAGN